MVAQEPSRTHYWTTVGIVALAAVGFALWRAWVTDDAFITFRHVVNCLAGHGPVFNAGQRVQGFTHPLWFLLLLLGGRFVDLYVWAVLLGLAATAALVAALGFLLRHQPRAWVRFLLVAAVPLSSTTFVEYQTSGLETSLTNLLLVILWGWLLTRATQGQPPPFAGAGLLCSLLLLNRPDHAVICAPVVVWLIAHAWRSHRWRAWRWFILALVPLLAWYGFAAIYYGTPMPNTAYSKVALPLPVRLRQGGFYLLNYAQHETLQAIVILAVLIAGPVLAARNLARGKRTQGGLELVLLAALWLQIAYVVSIGGDFMRGRFLISSLVGSALLMGHLLAPFLETRQCVRPLLAALAAGLPLLCLSKVDADHLVAAAILTFRMLQGHEPWVGEWLPAALLAGATIAAWCTITWCRQGSLRTPWLPVTVILQLACVIAVWGRPFTPPMSVLAFAAALGCSVYLYGRFAWRNTTTSYHGVTLGLLLAAAVSSLCHPGERIPDMVCEHLIADEYLWYAGRWYDPRFCEPPIQVAGVGQTNVQIGEQLRRYARQYGQTTILFGTIGKLGYHAGPQVHIIDAYGLVDAFVARCPAFAGSRVGHIEHEIPRAYLEMNGPINLLPDWERRFKEQDPTLAAQAQEMVRQAHWADPNDEARYQAIRMMVTGPVFSPERLRQIPRYAFLGR